MSFGEDNGHVEDLVRAYRAFAEAGGTLEEMHDSLAFHIWGDEELLRQFLENEMAKQAICR
jgi:hypothetical protein